MTHIYQHQPIFNKMTACFYPPCLLSKSLERFRFLDTIIVKYELNNKKLDDILTTILMNYCKMNIMGYNTDTQKYWCKQNKDTHCDLYIELQIHHYKGNDFIRLNPLIGCDLHIKKIVNQLKHAIELYNKKQDWSQ
jgi:hypothetical protein